jgi:uncharacterized phage protein (TIGR01671 family)
MRDIVFRGKPKNEAEYETLRELSEDDCENGFVYGSLVVSHNKYYICTMALQIGGGISDYITTMIDVLPETVGQYTGLKDKNGTKIFEDDIVTMPSYGGGRCKSVVYFKSGKFAVDGSNYGFKNICPKNMLVIGNIYDNPELLGGNNNG